MKIAKMETLHADGGWRSLDFLKITAESGLVGWSAVVPNLRIMEIDPDMVPWQDDLVTVKPRIEDGHLILPTGPGWGTEIDEDAVRAHPVSR